MSELFLRTMLLALRMPARVRKAAFGAARGDDRGDVPGWVLVTLMTAGLVGALWTLADARLAALFEQAISSVTRS